MLLREIFGEDKNKSIGEHNSHNNNDWLQFVRDVEEREVWGKKRKISSILARICSTDLTNIIDGCMSADLVAKNNEL